MLGLIVAKSKNNVIGKKGRIPWEIPGEQKQFRELTTGNVVIMGRHTYEEIGHPLPDRDTIVVSQSKTYRGEHLRTAPSVREAMRMLGDRDGFLAGGYEVYREGLPFVEVMYITEVDLEVKEGDTFFPEFNKENFEIQVGETLGNDVKYTRMVYFRKNLDGSIPDGDIK